MKYKQIKKLGWKVPSNPMFSFAEKKGKNIEKGRKILVQFFWPAFFEKKKKKKIQPGFYLIT